VAEERTVDLAELERYLRIFQENPDSRVFAPLADLYRRLGRLRESEDICREGIQRHPYYAGGRVALAHVLLDFGRLDEALVEVDSVVTYYPDNLLARKILIRVLGGLGQTDRARREFEALKGLAPLVATDPELARALQGKPKGLAAVPPASPMSVPDTTSVRIHEETTQPSGHVLPLETLPPLPLDFPMNDALEESDPGAPALQRSRRLSVLLRKRMILEGLIREFEKPF